MKKTLQSLALIALSLIGVKESTAQLADGSVAPDWTLTDINGNSHHLYAYLDSGYTVFIDFSATWCSPCWAYHTSGELDNLFENHGPAGMTNVLANTTDDVMVFFIEGDATTTAADLNGTGGNTQGDWVAGTTYPIIDDASQDQAYAIGYWPTVYKICPNRLIEEVQQISAANAYAKVGDCPIKANGMDLAIISDNGPFGACNEGSNANISVDVQNSGNTPITSATIEVRDGSTTVNTVNWTGSLNTWDIATVNLGAVPVTSTSNLKAVITTNDARATNNERNVEAYVAKVVPHDITVEVYTDNYPNETSWKIRKMSGQIVAHGGPYDANADKLTTKVHQVSLPSGDFCYKVELKDQYGDGINSGTNPADLYGLRIKVGTTVVFDLAHTSPWNFGNLVSKDAAIKTDASSAIEENSITAMSISPNPIANSATISFTNAKQGTQELSIMNSLGQVVLSQQVQTVAGDNQIAIDFSEFEKGIYIVVLKNEGEAVFSKIIKE